MWHPFFYLGERFGHQQQRQKDESRHLSTNVLGMFWTYAMGNTKQKSMLEVNKYICGSLRTAFVCCETSKACLIWTYATSWHSLHDNPLGNNWVWTKKRGHTKSRNYNIMERTRRNISTPMNDAKDRERWRTVIADDSITTPKRPMTGATGWVKSRKLQCCSSLYEAVVALILVNSTVGPMIPCLNLSGSGLFVVMSWLMNQSITIIKQCQLMFWEVSRYLGARVAQRLARMSAGRVVMCWEISFETGILFT